MRITLLTIVAFTMASQLNAADDAVEFFEKRIRPVLIKECFACHSSQAKSLKGGLSLETRDGLLKGGETGPALVAGKPDESLLLSALKHDGDVRMPPKGKLPDSVVRDFQRWIERGAPDPRKSIERRKADAKKTTNHWAYQPPKWSSAPRTNALGRSNDPLDDFILARLENEKLGPAPTAERGVLLRRVYLDLIGLPPSREELDAFAANADPTAYERVVDRLLASPAFGERWGRHWLDVARFAESLTLRGFLLKESWRYRDYVIDSFNDDVSFDRMIREQIAGDLLSSDDWREKRRLTTASAFLMLGDANLEEQDKKQLRMDVVDEQVDVVTKGFLAQTVTCARCHDHKFDPIPTKDYYAVAGIFRNVKAMEHANVSKLMDRPLPLDAESERRFKVHAELLKNAKSALAAARKKFGGAKSAKGIVAAASIPGIVVDDEQAKRVGDWVHSKFSGTYVGNGYLHDGNADKGAKTLTFQPELHHSGNYEVRLAYSPGTSRATNVAVTVFSADGEKTIPIDMTKSPPLDGRFISLGVYRFEKTGQGFVIISNEETTGHVTADAVAFLSEEHRSKSSAVSKGDKQIAALEAEMKRLESLPEARRPAVVAPMEEPKIEETHVHIRGSVHTLGEPAPRGVLSVALQGTKPNFPTDESGRRELTEWIASKNNPLTARVIVNRVWHWLFGAGLVGSPDNFGTTGDLPTHPELLDRLAIDFMNDGWSIKRLVRRLVLSDTYRRSSKASPEMLAADPENRWLARANRKRLDAEVIRDCILSATGRLDQRTRGADYPPTLAADYGFNANSRRRSVYLPVFRNALPDSLAVLDFPEPGAPTGRRNVSTVSTQALFFMNHPFVIESAKHAAARRPATNNDTNIDWLYRTLLGRAPSADELQIARRFLASESPTDDRWAGLVHALFCSADFRYCE
jgi:hypothetical protein